jgi:hypothetical protein
MSQSSGSGIIIGLLVLFLLGAIVGLGFLVSKNSDLTAELDKARKELDSKKEELVKKTKELDELSKGDKGNPVKLAEKDAEIIKLKADIDAIGVRLSNYTTFVTELKKNLMSISTNIAVTSMDTDIKNYSTVLTAINAVLADKDALIKNLDSKSTSAENQAALNRLLSGGKTFVSLETEYKNMTEMKTAFNSMVQTINNALANITIAANTEGSINIPNGVVISENKVLDKLNEHKNYISVTRKLINDIIDKLGSTVTEKDATKYTTAQQVMELLNKHIASTTNAENNYKAKISALELELSKFKFTNNRIPVSFLKDTILFGLDINTHRTDNQPSGSLLSNQVFSYEPRQAAQEVCSTDRYCASTTFSSADMIPFHVWSGRSINDNDAGNSYNMCESTGGIIDTIYKIQVQAFDQNNADDKKKCPDQRVKTTGLIPNILGKNSIKLADLNAPDPCPDVRKNWTFEVGCTKPVGVFLNSAFDGTKITPTKIAKKDATWNVGISKPHFIDWKNSLDGKDPFGYDENLKTLDFTKINSAATGSNGILFRNTELGGQNLGPSREVTSLKECVDYLNSYGTIPTKAAIISKDAVSNYKFICQPRGKVPAKGAVSATATSAAQPAVPEQNIKLFRNIDSSNQWDVYVPGDVVPDFDF